MKLYTEAEIVNFLKKEFADEINAETFMENLTPIELPSDEEIDRESELLYPINEGGSMWMPSRSDIDKYNRQEGFLACAKWMRDKIQGGNK